MGSALTRLVMVIVAWALFGPLGLIALTLGLILRAVLRRSRWRWPGTKP